MKRRSRPVADHCALEDGAEALSAGIAPDHPHKRAAAEIRRVVRRGQRLGLSRGVILRMVQGELDSPRRRRRRAGRKPRLDVTRAIELRREFRRILTPKQYWPVIYRQVLPCYDGMPMAERKAAADSLRSGVRARISHHKRTRKAKAHSLRRTRRDPAPLPPRG